MARLISCDAHDYFEIVCMRRSFVRITTFNKRTYQGIASNISIENNQEMLEVLMESKNQYIYLTEIKKLEAINNPVKNHDFSIEF